MADEEIRVLGDELRCRHATVELLQHAIGENDSDDGGSTGSERVKVPHSWGRDSFGLARALSLSLARSLALVLRAQSGALPTHQLVTHDPLPLLLLLRSPPLAPSLSSLSSPSPHSNPLLYITRMPSFVSCNTPLPLLAFLL